MMIRIVFFLVLTFIASSCAKKTVASFAPSAVNSAPSKAVVTEGEKQRMVNELAPTNNINQAAPHHVPQKSIEATLPATAAPSEPSAPKAQDVAATLHVDRILEPAPVKAFIKKAAFHQAKAAPRGARNWAPQLKIGLTLLAIGVVLAVFGLGFVGGLAALIGLCFTIVGLLVTY